MYLRRVQARFHDSGNIMWCFGLEHIFAFYIVGELRRSDVLGHGVANELEERKRRRASHIDLSS